MNDTQYENWSEACYDEFHGWIIKHFTPIEDARDDWKARIQRTEDEWIQFLKDSEMLCQFNNSQDFEATDMEGTGEPAFYVFKRYTKDGHKYEPIEGMCIHFSGEMTYC